MALDRNEEGWAIPISENEAKNLMAQWDLIVDRLTYQTSNLDVWNRTLNEVLAKRRDDMESNRKEQENYAKHYKPIPVPPDATLEELINLRIFENPLPQDEINYLLPYDGIDKEILHVPKERQIQILASRIKSYNDDRYAVDDSHKLLYARIIEDYKEKYNYPLRHYSNFLNPIIKSRIEKKMNYPYAVIKNQKFKRKFEENNVDIVSIGGMISNKVGELLNDYESQKYCEQLLNSLLQNDKQKKIRTPQKINWLGSGAQFGFLINELIEKGWIAQPTNSLKKDAVFYLEHFEINCKLASLQKELSKNQNSLSKDSARELTLPDKNKLR